MGMQCNGGRVEAMLICSETAACHSSIRGLKRALESMTTPGDLSRCDSMHDSTLGQESRRQLRHLRRLAQDIDD